jgi:ATP-dependent Clp protease adaptor protein ClpS
MQNAGQGLVSFALIRTIDGISRGKIWLPVPNMPNSGGNSVLLETQKSKVKPPPMFKVVLLNDDYTPMDFVVSVLQTFFSLSREQATQIMLKVHREGMGVCGVYPKDVAATKVEQVIAFSRKHEHPLQCVMEEA